MATSPLFGWEEPDDVDLVKDGAAAMRTLGNAIDASMGDLLGGTSGQVLSKASNADMDFAWVTSDDANAIQNSIINAKGDLIAGSADDTPAILSAGANGETLVADSSTSTGLRYQVPVNANPVLNSSFQIWQRGTSISYSANQAYNADRWLTQMPAAGTVSRQLTNDTTNLPFIQYCARVQRTSGQTATSAHFLYQNFESINSIPYAGKTVTYSFYARAGANYSATSNALVANLYSGTGTDQNVLSTYTGFATVATTTATLTTTWQRFSVTGTVATSATELSLGFSFTPTGTAGANDWFEVTGVQLEVGSVATPFKTYAATIQGELAAAQRYYFRSFPELTSSIYGMGLASSTTQTEIVVNLPVTMRTSPASIDSASIQISDGVTGYSSGTFILSSTRKTPNVGLIIYQHGSAALTQYRPYRLENASTTAGYIGFSAEL